MEARQLLLTPIFKEKICRNLTFKDALRFRDALGLPSLKCPIPVFDPNLSKEIVLPGVNPETIAIYELIKEETQNAFLKAAFNGNNERVKTLSTFKYINDIDINTVEKYGKTALIMAVENGHHRVVQTLLNIEGIDVNTINKSGKTALMLAANFGLNAMVKILLTAEGIDVNKTDQYGDTALMLAAVNGDNKMVQTLIEAKANVNAVDHTGKTALMLAVEYGRNEIVQILSAAGAQ